MTRKKRTTGLPRKMWTEEEIKKLKRQYPNTKTEKLAKLMGRTVSSVSGMAFTLGISKSPEYLDSPDACRLRRGDEVGKSYRFAPGHVPANKGHKGWCPEGCKATQFKPREPQECTNYKPIGSLRLAERDGYLERKVSDDRNVVPARRWVAIHRLVWEAQHGPIPPGHAVVFKPGMKTVVEKEITIDRLELLTRAELMLRNSFHTNLPPELASLVQLRGAVTRQINKRKEKSDGS